jgi:hypothetical protein
MGMRLAFSKGSEGIKGSPYVEFDEGNRFIFSMLTAGDKGIKYLLYSNQFMNGDGRQRDNLSFFTTMYMKGTEELPTMGLPSYFKRLPYYQNGTVDALKDILAKYLTGDGIFPFEAFPKLAEDIVKWNEKNPDLAGTIEVKDTKRLIRPRKERKSRLVEPDGSEGDSGEPAEEPEKKGRKPRADKGKKRVEEKPKKKKKTRKTRSDKGKKKVEKKPKKVKKTKASKTIKVVKKPKKVKKSKASNKVKVPMRKAAKGKKKAKRGKR